MIGDEIPVRAGQFPHLRQQAALYMRPAAMDVRIMVLERQHGFRFVQAQLRAEGFTQHEAAHRGVYVVDETDIRAHEHSRTGSLVRRAVRRRDRMARQDLCHQGLRSFMWNGRGRHRREPFRAVAQQPAAAQHRGRDCVAAGHQLRDIDRLAAPDALDQAQVGRGEQAHIVGVLAVEPLETFSDHQANAGGLLRQRAVLA